MIVVADASPLIGLLKIGQVGVLSALYGSVVIPEQVARELSDPKRPPLVVAFMTARPSWLAVRAPTSVEMIPDLDLGESAAISLAREIRADLLLIDESKGRQAAIARNLRTARTGAILFDAANAGIISDLKTVFDQLRTTNFRIPSDVMDELLKRHLALKTGGQPL